MTASAVGRSLVVLLIASAFTAGAVTTEQVEPAIEKGVKWLLDQNKNGTWEEVPAPQGADHEANGRQWGGRTALAVYALLASGQSSQEPRIKQAIDFLKKADLQGTYAIALRCQVWYFLPNNAETRSLVARDAQALLACMRVKGKAHGLFRYWKGSGADDYCHSCSNYGVLGLWACAQQNYEVGPRIWRSFEDAWRRHQYDDGAWSYQYNLSEEGSGRRTVSMTAAGVATLFITQDYAHAMEGIGCAGNAWDPNIQRGIQWLTQNFDKFEQVWPFYALYNIERVGTASGMKYLGNIDWYDRGAQWILKRQHGDGSWGAVHDTAFALLFLNRGRAPIVMNKLDYTPENFLGKNPRAIPAPWNQRSRDVANISRWIGRQMERDLNWQVVHLQAPIDQLHDAPILYIAGSKALSFTPEEREKLRLWVQQGGLILGNADCGRPAFIDSFKQLGETLFAPYKFRELPADHPIYQDEQFRRINWRDPPTLLGLSNGARELMLLIPVADPAKYWQQQSFLGPEREPLAQLMANIFLYAVDKQNLRFRGERFITEPKSGIKPSRTIKLARLQYDGNWNPEPYGWTHLGTVLLNDQATELKVSMVPLGKGKLTKDFTAAHLTGTAAFTLEGPARTELRKYIEAGGTLIVDACGGNKEFALAAEAEIHDLFPAAKLELLPAKDPVYNVVKPPLAQADYRAFYIKNVGRTYVPRLRGMKIKDRTAILFSPEDLSVGLVGQPIDGILGYEPKSARQVMSDALLYAAGLRPEGLAGPKPVAFELTKDVEKFAPGWSAAGCVKVDDPGFKASLAGRQNALVSAALDEKTPFSLSRRQPIPAGRETLLVLAVGHPPKGGWTLLVRADGQDIFKAPVTVETCQNGWREVQVDLSPFAGKVIMLELIQQPLPGADNRTAWWGHIKYRLKRD